MEKTKWKRVNDAWDSYFAKHVIKSEHLKKVLMHSMLGTMIPTTFTFAGKRITSRLPVFIIQNSGTAKSVGMKATEKLLKKLGKSTLYTLRVTDAKLGGSIDPPTKKNDEPVEVPGLLNYLHFLAIDEGGILLRSGPYNENLIDIVQQALDEPGQVSRAMKYGILDYRTDTTIVSGSYPRTEMGEIILTRGMFQRFYLVAYSFTDEEIKEIDDGFNELFDDLTIDCSEEISSLKEELKDFPKSIEVDKSDLIRFYNEVLKEFRDNTIFKQYKDEKEDILKSFWFRIRIKMLKFATHYAVLNGKTKIDYESLEYAFKFVQDEVRYVKQILEKTHIDKSRSGKDREGMVLRTLETPLSRPELLEKLKGKGNWDMGYNRTVEFLKQMEENGLLNVDRNQKPHIYRLS